MVRTPRRPDVLAGTIFRGRDVIEHGILSKAELRSPVWRRLFRGVYADRDLEITHDERCRAAGRFILPRSAAIAGRSAAHVHGVAPVGAQHPVEAVLPRHARFGPVAGIRSHLDQLTASEVAEHGGLRVTSPERTCWDVAQWLDPADAVALIDVYVRKRLVTVDRLLAYARRRPSGRGQRRFRRVVGLVDPTAESPQESRLRARLVLAGLPTPVSQYVVEHAGTFVARVDLAWPQARLAVEYDGLWHAAEEQIHLDRERLNKLVGAGWTVLHVTSKRMRDDFPGVVAEIRAAMARGQKRSTGW